MFTLLILAVLAGDVHQPMDSGLGCETCHAAPGLNPDRLRDALTRSDLCVSCHDERGDAAPMMKLEEGPHPVQVAYEGSALASVDGVGEAGLRLVQHGAAQYVECISCHDAHPNGRRDMLRVERALICEGCHER